MARGSGSGLERAQPLLGSATDIARAHTATVDYIAPALAPRPRGTRPWLATPPLQLILPPAKAPEEGFLLVVLGPSDCVLTRRDGQASMPCARGRLLVGDALARGKRLAAHLLQHQAPEVWAAMLADDGGRAARAFFHVLLACAPHDAAPAGYCWSCPDIVVSFLLEYEPWLRAAADAVAAVRQVPDTLLPELAQTQLQHMAQVCMRRLEQQARAANTMLLDCCLDTLGPPWHPELFNEWGDRIPVLGIPEAAGATSCQGPFHLPPAVALLPYRFNSTEFGPPTTVAAQPVPKQVSTYKQAPVRDILTAEALNEIYQWFRC
jgi:hypothetical protein